MAIQLSTNARNGLLDAIETEWGASPVLKIRTGAPPAACATTDSGTVLATMTLPADSMAAATGGTKAKSGTWEDLNADAAGIHGHFRIYKSDGVTCVLQGTTTDTGQGGDMTLNTNDENIGAGQPITVTSFTLTAPGA